MAYQILVVDTQRETSKAIRTGIQSLGPEFVVATTLSGEEAMLEARLRKFDLLVSEVRLSGMSGVELVRKLRASKPDIKVILISTTVDRYIRREVADVGVENLLQKPLDIAELLNEVKKVLGIGVPTPKIAIPDEKPVEEEPIGISDRLASLRQELSASLALLMSDTGEILMQAGDVQPWGLEAEMSSLTTIFSAGNKVARLLGLSVADNFYAFKGSKLDLIMTQVGESHALLIGMPSASTALPQMDKIYAVVQKGAHDLQTILADMGVALTAPAESLPGEPLSTPLEELETFQETFEIDPGLDALFAKVDKTSLEADLDSFWEVSPVEDTGIFAGADALSYEQARQLGLAPNEEG